MLALTKKTDYALIALSHLARTDDGPVSARQIAEQYSMPQPLLMNVLKRLARCGLIKSVRGARGGYRLAVRPDELTLATLIEAMEGPIGLVQCALERPLRNGRAVCRVGENCPIRQPARKIHRKLHDFLEQVTLADMLEADEQHAQPADGAEALPEAEPAYEQAASAHGEAL